MTKLLASTPFINVVVKVRPKAEPGQYTVETAPAIPWVTQKDTVINYQIYNTGDNEIFFTGMSVTPEHNLQLSTPSLSISRKQLTFSDANTAPIALNITLHFTDSQGVLFSHDPQVQNQPEQ